jgi:signal transduction histidine kinase
MEAIGAALVICSKDGTVAAATPSGRALLIDAGLAPTSSPYHLPAPFWLEASSSPFGEAIEWSPSAEAGSPRLGLTSYPVGSTHTLLIMREISEKQLDLSRRLNQHRLSAIGRVAATVVHDLRAALSGVTYNADVLATATRPIPTDVEREIVSSIQHGAERLGETIDALLDFARLGPPRPVDVSLQQVVERSFSLLRPQFREGRHRTTSTLNPAAAWARGNPLAIENILVNVLLNAIDASGGPAEIHVATAPCAPREDGPPRVAIQVCDDGPGIPAERAARIFEPFFTTRPEGTGLGLTLARESAMDLGGDLVLVPSERGACFEIQLLAAPSRGRDGGPP